MNATTQQLLRISGPPAFQTVEEERRHRKERLAGAFRLFSKFGFDEGVAGHITAQRNSDGGVNFDVGEGGGLG